MQENQVPQKKSSWLKQETSFLECSEQGRELQTFRVQWLLWNTVALEGHGKSLVWYFLCKIILECTEKLSPFLSCQIETLGQSCCPVPSFLQGCCPSTATSAGMGLCGQAAAAVHCWLQAEHFPNTHRQTPRAPHTRWDLQELSLLNCFCCLWNWSSHIPPAQLGRWWKFWKLHFMSMRNMIEPSQKHNIQSLSTFSAFQLPSLIHQLMLPSRLWNSAFSSSHETAYKFLTALS